MKIIRCRSIFLILFFILIADSSLFAQIVGSESNNPSVKISRIKYNYGFPSAWKNIEVVSKEVSGSIFSTEILYIQFLDTEEKGISYEFEFNEIGGWGYTISTNLKILKYHDFVEIYVDDQKLEYHVGSINIDKSKIRIVSKMYYTEIG